jgi:hypothetical protein
MTAKREWWAEHTVTFGPDFRQYPAAWWGNRDRELVESRYRGLNKTLPAAAPTLTLPAGFSLFPNQQRAPLTKGERAVQEIRAALKIGTR